MAVCNVFPAASRQLDLKHCKTASSIARPFGPTEVGGSVLRSCGTLYFSAGEHMPRFVIAAKKAFFHPKHFGRFVKSRGCHRPSTHECVSRPNGVRLRESRSGLTSRMFSGTPT